jgi:catechol 2,3-dioxygenase-like lactoylglutathione lyase family enzyme
MIRQLDHYNIRTFRIDETVRFYVDVLGLRDGAFPGTPAMGAWLYDKSDRPVVHLIAIDPADPEPAVQRIRDRLAGLGDPVEPSSWKGGGAIDHVAFECDDYDTQACLLRERGIAFTESNIPSIGLRQIFLNDPNGVTLELNFR